MTKLQKGETCLSSKVHTASKECHKKELVNRSEFNSDIIIPNCQSFAEKAVNEAVEMNRAYLEGKKYIVFLNATAACECNKILAQITALESAPLRGV